MPSGFSGKKISFPMVCFYRSLTALLGKSERKEVADNRFKKRIFEADAISER
jgi:hypothetical protein